MDFAFEFRSYRTAFKEPMRTAHGDWTHREGIIVRVSNESGRAGFGEIAPIPWFGTETQEQALEFCRKLDKRLDHAALEAIPDELPCCQFGFGSALEALAGASHSPQASRTEVACLLPAGPEALAAARRALHAGFTRLKWKVGVGDVDAEIGILRMLLDGLPTGVVLRLDANGAWDRHDAWEWIDACEGRAIEFIEQPFPRGADAELLEFGTKHPGLFALDESVTPPGELWRWLEAGWPGVVVVKPSLAGNPAKLRGMLAAYKADVVFSTALETSVGWRAAANFADSLSFARKSRALGFGAGELFADSSLNPPPPTPMLPACSPSTANDTWNRLAS